METYHKSVNDLVGAFEDTGVTSSCARGGKAIEDGDWENLVNMRS